MQEIRNANCDSIVVAGILADDPKCSFDCCRDLQLKIKVSSHLIKDKSAPARMTPDWLTARFNVGTAQ